MKPWARSTPWLLNIKFSKIIDNNSSLNLIFVYSCHYNRWTLNIFRVISLSLTFNFSHFCTFSIITISYKFLYSNFLHLATSENSTININDHCPPHIPDYVWTNWNFFHKITFWCWIWTFIWHVLQKFEKFSSSWWTENVPYFSACDPFQYVQADNEKFLFIDYRHHNK